MHTSDVKLVGPLTCASGQKSERSALLKVFDVFLKFALPKARFLNFPQNSTRNPIGSFLIIGDCVYLTVNEINRD